VSDRRKKKNLKRKRRAKISAVSHSQLRVENSGFETKEINRQLELSVLSKKPDIVELKLPNPKKFLEKTSSDYKVEKKRKPSFINFAAKKVGKILFSKVFILFFLLGIVIFGVEARTSFWQSIVFSRIAKGFSYELKEGESLNSLAFDGGPYDWRLGYSRIPEFITKLKTANFIVTKQATISKRFSEASSWGVFPIYNEKNQGGLEILDRQSNLVSKTQFPESVYRNFDEVPKVVADTLLYIEDRKLLEASFPHRNPTLDWERLFKASLDFVKSIFDSEHNVPGGSTLATQLEKFRHSPQGITHSPIDKLRQMLSASFRSYRDGKNTIEARKSILVNYINTVPLAALPGFGEVNGISDGLWAYYGTSFDVANEILASLDSKKKTEETSTALIEKQGLIYRQVLSLFLAHRRPSEMLREDPKFLNDKTDSYLSLLFRDGIISKELSLSAKKANTIPRRSHNILDDQSYVFRKGQNLIRGHLLNILGIERLYDLDRLDLKVKTTIDSKVQNGVTKTLAGLKDQKGIEELGLLGDRLLSHRGDLSDVIYSFTLFESDGKVNKLKIQTDNFNQPFNINEGAKLDLGSTAKLRTLITYLQVIEELHGKFLNFDAEKLKLEKNKVSDPLSLWVIDYLLNDRERELSKILKAAMERKYSANPGEAFFTAGGVHRFENFKSEDNGKVVTVSEAMRHSINLPFVRLMRDLVYYFQFHVAGSTAKTLDKLEEMPRREYLQKFADQEGKVFLGKFYKKYRDKSPEQIMEILLDGVEYKPKRFAAIYWVLRQNLKASEDRSEFVAFLRKYFSSKEFSEQELDSWQKTYANPNFSLADKGYIARVHPLELWIASYMYKNPKAKLVEVYENSREERQEVYNWLFSAKKKRAQDVRIRTILEAEAFVEIHKRWKSLGYPLASLVPSYATALGTSADRPSALAELMGIIVNSGHHLPSVKIEELKFAENTPYETHLVLNPGDRAKVLNSEIASIVKNALLDIVANGTAIRLKNGIKLGDKVYPVGGKTGTGDHRLDSYTQGGRLKESKVINRTATFVFFIGDKYFGTITAIVRGEKAEKFKFTSSLPVQILKSISEPLEGLESVS
jgi:membrane peptidoglycan carboxypeptidase